MGPFRALLVAAVLLPAAAMPRDVEPDDGVGVLRAMHQRWAPRVRALAVVKVARFRDGRTQRWYESVLPPGRRRLDVGALDSLNGLLFRSDSLYEIAGGRAGSARALAHPLSLLLFDVAARPPDSVAAILTRVGFDLSRLRADRWAERPVWVVGGTGPDDRTTRQFWVDRRSLRLVRLIEPRDIVPADPRETPLVQEVWAEGTVANVPWLPASLVYFRNGRQFLEERVERAAQVGNLSAGDFLPGPWRRADWFDADGPKERPRSSHGARAGATAAQPTDTTVP